MLTLLFTTALAAKPAPAPTPPPRDPTTAAIVRLHMSEHLARALSASQAVVRGDLLRARADLAWMADHVEPEPVADIGKAAVDGLHAAARSGLQGSTVADYGLAVGKMGAACGACHVAASAGLSPIVSSRPAPDGGHGMVSAWIVSSMWTGLVSSADSAWGAAAEALAASPNDLGAYGTPKAGPAGQLAVAVLQAQAKAAPAATTRDQRADVYGRVIGACGACHMENPSTK